MRSTIVCDTPVGPLYVLVDDAVVGVTAAGQEAPWAVVGAAFGAAGESMPPVVPAATGVLADVARAVAAWSAHGDDSLGSVPVSQPGGPFRQRVWQSLRSVPAGDVITYAALAAVAGNPRAVRAAGTAMATNAVAPFVPCHRVIRTGGQIGNYAYGVDSKRRLLVHEGAAGIH